MHMAASVKETRAQGRIQGVCLPVMTSPFVPQFLSIKADAGL